VSQNREELKQQHVLGDRRRCGRQGRSVPVPVLLQGLGGGTGGAGGQQGVVRRPQAQGGGLPLAGVGAELGGQLVGDRGTGHDGNTVEEGRGEVPEERKRKRFVLGMVTVTICVGSCGCINLVASLVWTGCLEGGNGSVST